MATFIDIAPKKTLTMGRGTPLQLQIDLSLKMAKKVQQNHFITPEVFAAAFDLQCIEFNPPAFFIRLPLAVIL